MLVPPTSKIAPDVGVVVFIYVFVKVVIPDTFNDEIQVTLLFNLLVPLILIFPELNIELVDTVLI